MNSLQRTDGFGFFYDGVETSRVGYSDFTKHFPVQLDVCFFTAVDKLAVSYIPLATGGAKARNPKTAKISFSAFAVDTGIDTCTDDSFFCRTVKMASRCSIPFYRFEDSFLCLVPCSTFSNSWHFY